ncbi:antigen [Methanosarcina sp. MTP4]|uniref:PRC-barrel domain-containing protein n=1 Tax=Methanosarcina sp. MTP4 TaxID=1434100 RepID=UPI000615EE1E|nr:PRC-barrel domain-containing protein [Methanosarcina sp. MTP4]AKB26270.1 antigen [Methanosarcina sp. MTP4]
MGIDEEIQVPRHRTFVAATEIKGSKILTVKDEELGTIKEVMIDSERGRIAYVVFACDCFLGMKCKYFAIPWGVLEANRGAYILNVDKGAFETAEGLDKDVWSLNHNDLVKVYEQYNLQPYWEI